MKKRNILFAIVGILVLIQFFQIDKTNPAIDTAQDFIALENPPEEIANMLKNACYDCHSHGTKYPWYTSIQPLGWWIRGHYRGGRMNVNYSEWGTYEGDDKAHAWHEMVEVMEDKRMPLKSYTWMHPEAKLSDSQKEELLVYFKENSK